MLSSLLSLRSCYQLPELPPILGDGSVYPSQKGRRTGCWLQPLPLKDALTLSSAPRVYLPSYSSCPLLESYANKLSARTGMAGPRTKEAAVERVRHLKEYQLDHRALHLRSQWIIHLPDESNYCSYALSDRALRLKPQKLGNKKYKNTLQSGTWHWFIIPAAKCDICR